MKKRTLTCVVCPNGCELAAYFIKNGSLIIEGTECKRGILWAEQEIKNPKRTIASSVLVINGDYPLVSVKTEHPVSLDLIPKIMIEIKSLKLQAPVKIGEVIIRNVAKSNISIIATRNILKKN